MKIYYEDGSWILINFPKYTNKEKQAIFQGVGKIKKTKVKLGKPRTTK